MVKHVSGAYRKLTLICHLANEPLESGCQAVYGIKNNILWFQKKIQNKTKKKLTRGHSIKLFMFNAVVHH